MSHAWQHSDMSPPSPSHPSCCWEACPDTTKRTHPQASQTNILSSQITASVSLTSSAGSVMGQRSIGRFADISWILPHTPTTGIPVRRAAFDRDTHVAEHVAIFTHVHCRALPLRQPAPPIGAIRSSLAWRCDKCDSSVLPSPASSCSSMPSISSQSRCSLA
ncbi:hypothetical protein TcG_11391, partial [Trypanosoma cruzi]